MNAHGELLETSERDKYEQSCALEDYPSNTRTVRQERKTREKVSGTMVTVQ